MKDLLEELIEIKNKKKIKTSYIADKIGISLVATYRWIDGTRSPSFEHIKKLADILGYEIKLVPKEEDNNG